MKAQFYKGFGFTLSSKDEKAVNELLELSKNGHLHLAFKGKINQRGGAKSLHFHYSLVKWKRNGNILSETKLKAPQP